MSERTCTGHRSLGPCYISVGIRRQCQHKTGPWYLLTILIRSGTWFGLWDENPQFSILHFPKFAKFKMFSPVTSLVDGWARRGCGRDRVGVSRHNSQSHLRSSAQSRRGSANQRCRLSRQSSPTFTSLSQTNNSLR